MYYLGIDLGGTNIAAAAVDENGRILGRCSRPTPKAGPAAVADDMAAAVREAAAQAALSVEGAEGIGLGSPGTVDPDTGVIHYWSNLDFRNVPISALLEERLGRGVGLENDANAAALGEFVAGAGRGSASLVAVTLGTGVGGGAVLGGKLYTGFNHAGMEIGHFVLQQGGRPCTCGRQGCFEAYCSAPALIKRTREVLGLPAANGRTAFEAAGAGDPKAKAVVEEYISYLGGGIASLVNIFQPEVLCLGGGIANQGEALLAPLREILDREDYARNQIRRTRLVRAELGNDAGIIGAALLSRFR